LNKLPSSGKNGKTRTFTDLAVILIRLRQFG